MAATIKRAPVEWLGEWGDAQSSSTVGCSDEEGHRRHALLELGKTFF